MSEFDLLTRYTRIVDPGVMFLISINDVQEEIVYAESNHHVTDEVTRPYDVTVVTLLNSLPSC